MAEKNEHSKRDIVCEVRLCGCPLVPSQTTPSAVSLSSFSFYSTRLFVIFAIKTRVGIFFLQYPSLVICVNTNMSGELRMLTRPVDQRCSALSAVQAAWALLTSSLSSTPLTTMQTRNNVTGYVDRASSSGGPCFIRSSKYCVYQVKGTR